MVYFILFIIAIALTMLFFLLVNYASKSNLKVIEGKTSGFFQQVILRILVGGIGFGMIFSIWQIQKVVFVAPQSGYDMKAIGINIFAAIGYIIIIFSLLICFDYILFPRNASKKTGNPMNFHLGLKLRTKLMTILFFVSICLVLLDMFNYTYYKTGGEIVIREVWGFRTTHYFNNDIKVVNINSYKGKGGTFTELIITFSDGRMLIANDDSDGSKKLLSEWQGKIKMTNEGK